MIVNFYFAALIGVIVGAAVGFIGAALMRAAKGEPPKKVEEQPRECVMEERNELFYSVFRCSACGEDIVDDTESEELGWKFCPECGAKIVGVKKIEEAEHDIS